MPSGVDPGGVAIALIGTGVDYTIPDIAKRLARDGEGEIIGWDFIANDRRPFEPYTTTTPQAAVFVALEEAPDARFVVLRTAVTEGRSVADAIAYAAATPARIVLLDVVAAGAHIERAALELAAAAGRRFPEVLFVVPVGDRASDHGVKPEVPEPLANVIFVALAALKPAQVSDRPDDPSSVVSDIAVVGDHTWEFWSGGGHTSSFDVFPAAAAARTAALAARILAAEPTLSSADLKLKIVALATPFSLGQPKVARHGWFERPDAVYPRN